MKKITTTRTPNPQARGKLIGFKANAEETKLIEKLALAHAGGNVSAFVRYAALNFRLKKAKHE